MSQTNEGLGSAMFRAAMDKAATDATDKDADPLNDELQAMRSVARTLEKLPPSAQQRVVNWLLSRFNEPRNFAGTIATQVSGMAGKGYP